MSRTELAKRTGLSEKHIIAILKGKGTIIITPETAIKLERALGMPVDYWLNLEAHYQETRARLAEVVQLEKDLGYGSSRQGLDVSPASLMGPLVRQCHGTTSGVCSGPAT
jgi:plasmid maintenance system antidote protein VapI